MTSEDIKHQLNNKVSVPCAEKCWSTPPSPENLHAEKCVTLPLEDHVLKSADPTPTLRVHTLKSVLLFPSVEDLVLKSASPPLPPEFTC